MQITVRGLWRNRGRRRIADRYIDERSASNPQVAIWTGGTLVEQDVLRVYARADKVKMGGDYAVELSISKTELANLVRVAWGEQPFAEVLEILTKKRPDVAKAAGR